MSDTTKELIFEDYKDYLIKSYESLILSQYSNKKIITRLNIRDYIRDFNELDILNEFLDVVESKTANNLSEESFFSKNEVSSVLINKTLSLVDKEKQKIILKTILQKYNNFVGIARREKKYEKTFDSFDNLFLELIKSYSEVFAEIKDEIFQENIKSVKSFFLTRNSLEKSNIFLNALTNKKDKVISNLMYVDEILKNPDAVEYLLTQQYVWDSNCLNLNNILISKNNISKIAKTDFTIDAIIAYVNTKNLSPQIKILAFNSVINDNFLDNPNFKNESVIDFLLKNLTSLNEQIVSKILLKSVSINSSSAYIKNITTFWREYIEHSDNTVNLTQEQKINVIENISDNFIFNKGQYNGFLNVLLKPLSDVECNTLLSRILSKNVVSINDLESFFTPEQIKNAANEKTLIDNLLEIKNKYKTTHLVDFMSAESISAIINNLEKLNIEEKNILLERVWQQDIKDNNIFYFIKKYLDIVSQEKSYTFALEDKIFTSYLEKCYEYIRENKVIIKAENLPIRALNQLLPTKFGFLVETFFVDILENKLNNKYYSEERYKYSFAGPIYKLFNLKNNAPYSMTSTKSIYRFLSLIFFKNKMITKYSKENNDTKYILLQPGKDAIYTENKDISVINFSSKTEKRSDAIEQVSKYVLDNKDGGIDFKYQLSVDNLLMNLTLFVKELDLMNESGLIGGQNYKYIVKDMPQNIQESYKLYLKNLKNNNTNKQELSDAMIDNITLIINNFEIVKEQINQEIKNSNLKDVRVHNKLMRNQLGAIK